MGVGSRLILIAVGAVLSWAVHTSNSHGIDINTIGYIVLAVGAAGLLISMMFWSSWAGPGYFSRRRTYGEARSPWPFALAAPASRQRRQRAADVAPRPERL